MLKNLSLTKGEFRNEKLIVASLLLPHSENPIISYFLLQRNKAEE